MDLSTISLLDNYPIPSISFIKVDDNNQIFIIFVFNNKNIKNH